MGISPQLYRQRIGLNSVNFRTKTTTNVGNTFSFQLCTFLQKKSRLFFLNSLSINTSFFVCFSQIVSACLNIPDPISTALISILTVVFCINITQFLLINGYAFLINLTRLFYAIILFFTWMDNSESFIKFFSYKMLDMLTHGDIEVHPGPPHPFQIHPLEFKFDSSSRFRARLPITSLCHPREIKCNSCNRKRT